MRNVCLFIILKTFFTITLFLNDNKTRLMFKDH